MREKVTALLLSPVPEKVVSVPVPVPPLSPEQRVDALARATAARRRRAEVKEGLKRGGARLADVIAEGRQDDAIAKLKVSELIESLPGVGQVTAAQVMEDIGIAGSRRVRGLGHHQARALLERFEEA